MKKPVFGPGALVAAAFIGPGTVTTCTLAGANFGTGLLWALVFATLATMVLQDMSVRLGVGARLGLGEALVGHTSSPKLKWAVRILVFVALAVGNAAYESGNLAGAGLGLGALMGETSLSPQVNALIVGVLTIPLLLFAAYKHIERILVILVLGMSLAFTLSFVLAGPDISLMLKGLIPRVPEDGLLMTMALIGTTIVPYNLFLHASSAKKRWQDSQAVEEAQSEARWSIGLGGLVSIFILSTAASSLFSQSLRVNSAAEMAISLEPILGPGARYMIGLGLLAAGLTSAITAPLATAFALTELMPSKLSQHREKIFKSICLGVLVIGLAINLLKLKPLAIILVAQAANGILLPIVAIFLLKVMNDRHLVGNHANRLWGNILGCCVVGITLLLGLRMITKVLGILP